MKIMKNADTPIHPWPYVNSDGTIQHDVYFGLTKREHFVLELLKTNLIVENDAPVERIAGYLGITYDEYKGHEHFQKYVIKKTIDMVDNLFDELKTL